MPHLLAIPNGIYVLAITTIIQDMYMSTQHSRGHYWFKAIVKYGRSVMECDEPGT